MAGCFDTRRTTNNMFGWPIERLYAVVDLRSRDIVQVVDYGAIRISQKPMSIERETAESRRSSRSPVAATFKSTAAK